jgi:nitrogen-specific signal transduction histidine kinase
MKHENEEELRLLQLQFIGKILAGFTHEIKNYLAIIKESNGLIEDLITLGKTAQGDSEQYLEITRSIEEHIEKTNNLFRYLNRFAHRMDSQLATFNLNETLEELIALVTRFANQKKIHIGKDFQEDIPSVYSNPSLVQFVAFSFLHEKIKNLDSNSKITIQTFAAADKTVKIRIIPEGNVLEGNDDSPSITYENLEKIIKQLGGNIVQEKGQETLITLAMNPP